MMSSQLIAWYLSNLPAYRTVVSPLASALDTTGLITILSVFLTMYGVASFIVGEPSTAPMLTLTSHKKEADKL
ncbi:hypothetical protein GUJ93_ZPchr0002g26513 [Zizania palustris]|uniref:Uncharacterized protein n=1 Tax=Zizania palustris TaxID=103762 RepID=A0A8J5SC94_ZIZPA|nr:hypothetical protein GUJ93_ZPchr0002g26513 [Zizania palustris]